MWIPGELNVAAISKLNSGNDPGFTQFIVPPTNTKNSWLSTPTPFVMRES